LRYLADFAWSFYTLLSPLFDVLAGGVIVLGLFLAAAWAILPHIIRVSE
jgi:hypothetical protein